MSRHEPAEAQPFLFRWRHMLMYDPAISATDKHVGGTLSFHMDPDGRGAYPGMRLLADATSRKTTTVAQSIKRLERARYIVVTRDQSPRGIRAAANRYTARCPRCTKWSEGTTCTHDQVVPSGIRQVAPRDHGTLQGVQADGRPFRSPPSANKCSDCGTGEGRHLPDCPNATA